MVLRHQEKYYSRRSKHWIEDTGIEQEDMNSAMAVGWGWGFFSSLMKFFEIGSPHVSLSGLEL